MSGFSCFLIIFLFTDVMYFSWMPYFSHVLVTDVMDAMSISCVCHVSHALVNKAKYMLTQVKAYMDVIGEFHQALKSDICVIKRLRIKRKKFMDGKSVINIKL